MRSKSCSDSKVKASSEWAREAPMEATALIVAECTTKRFATPTRRVAIDWLFGERDKVAPLRAAAAKLADTALLAAAGPECERREGDGSVSLSMTERCQIRWTLRSIPVGIIQCWAGFEDGMLTGASPEPVKTNTATVLKPVDESAVAPSAKPLTVAASPQKPVPARPILPAIAPMEALILNSEQAFGGNCAPIDGKFITDGRCMLLRAACDDDFLAGLKAAKCGAFSPDNPVPEASTRRLFDATVQDAKHTAVVRGYILGSQAGPDFKADQPYACVVGPGDRVSIADAHRVRFIQSVTGANAVKVAVDPKSERLTFYRGNEAVGILMTMESPVLKSLFLQMIEHDRSPAQLSHATPATHRLAS